MGKGVGWEMEPSHSKVKAPTAMKAKKLDSRVGSGSEEKTRGKKTPRKKGGTENNRYRKMKANMATLTANERLVK